MRFKTIAFAFMVSSAVLILGCDDEDRSSIGGGGRLYFEVTVNPPLDSHTVYGGAGFAYGTTGDNFDPATGFTTDEFAVIKGQNLPVTITMTRTLTFPFPPTECGDVRVKAILDGNVFDDRTYNMGYHFDAFTQSPCPDGNFQQYNLIIP